MTGTQQIYQLSHLLPGLLMVHGSHAEFSSYVDCPSSWLTHAQALDHAAALYAVPLLSCRPCALTQVLQAQSCCSALCWQLQQVDPRHCLAAVDLQYLLQLKPAAPWSLLQRLVVRGHAG